MPLSDDDIREVKRILIEAYCSLEANLGGFQHLRFGTHLYVKTDMRVSPVIMFSEDDRVGDDYFSIGETPNKYAGTEDLKQEDIDFLFRVVPKVITAIPLTEEDRNMLKCLVELEGV